MALVRRNGILVDVPNDQLTVQELVAQNGGTPVTTALGATQLGANQDVAKMVGTAAQKQPVLEQQVAKEQTLAGAQRLDDPQAAAKVAQSQWLQTLQTSAGSLGQRVRDKAQEFLNQFNADKAAAAVQLPTSGEIADATGLTGDLLTAAQTLINNFYNKIITDGAAADTSAEIAAIEQFAKDNNIPVVNMQGFISDIKTKTGVAAYEQIKDKTITLAEILDPAEIDALRLLVSYDVGDMTIAEYQEHVRAQVRENYSQVDGLRAKLATVPKGSNRYKAIVRELTRLGASGVISQEEAAQRLQDEIDRADEFRIGDTDYTLDEILSDEFMNTEITAYLSLPTDKKSESEFAKNFPKLAKWADAHEAALSKIAGIETAEISQFEDTQNAAEVMANTTYAEWDKDVLAQAVGLNKWPEGNISETQLATLQGVTDSYLGPLLGEYEDLPEDHWLRKHVVDAAAFAQMKKDLPSLIKPLPNSTEEQRSAAIRAAVKDWGLRHTVEKDGLADWLGDTEVTAKSVADAQKVFKDLEENPNRAMFLADTNFKKLRDENPAKFAATLAAIKSGDVTWEEWVQFHEKKIELGAATTADEYLSTLVGATTTVTSINGKIAKLEFAASIGIAGAQEALDRVREAFGDTNGGDLTDQEIMAGVKSLVDSGEAAAINALDSITKADTTINEALESIGSASPLANAFKKVGNDGLIGSNYVESYAGLPDLMPLLNKPASAYTTAGFTATVRQLQMLITEHLATVIPEGIEGEHRNSYIITAMRDLGFDLTETGSAISVAFSRYIEGEPLAGEPQPSLYVEYVDLDFSDINTGLPEFDFAFGATEFDPTRHVGKRKKTWTGKMTPTKKSVEQAAEIAATATAGPSNTNVAKNIARVIKKGSKS